MDCNAIIDIIHTWQSTNLTEIVFKSLNLVKIVSTCLHWTPMRAVIAFFSNFGHQGCSLLMWFLDKSVVAVIQGVSMVNQRNAVEKIFFSLFQLLNIILDQFVECKLCVVMYYKFTDHRLVQNYI